MKILLTSDLHAKFSKDTTQIHLTFWEEVKAQAPDAIILAGDLGSSSHNHTAHCLKTMRKVLPDVAAAALLGNHDLWQQGARDEVGLYARIRRAERKLTIHKVFRLNPSKPFMAGDVRIYGYDGWYQDPDPCTNDCYWMPLDAEDGTPTHAALRSRANRDFDKLCQSLEETPTGVKRVAVTHHNIIGLANGHSGNPAHGEHLIHSGLCDAIMWGHTHRRFEAFVRGVHLLNSGSDYDAPRWVLLEL